MLTTSKRKNVYNKLKEAIAGGSFPPGSRLPNEPELAEVLGVSRLTLRYVLAQLETENTLVRIKGKGTFVKDVREERLRILVVMANIPNFTQEATLLNELYKVGEAHNALLDPVEPAVVRNMSDSEIKELFSSGRYRGMIYISFNLDEPEELRSIWKKLQVPSVFFFFNSRFTPPRMPGNALIVNCDVPGMIREALKYLGNCGHRQVFLLLDGNINCVSEKEALALLAECRMGCSENMVLSNRKGGKAWNQALLETLRSPDAPTAVCCGSSVMALKLYHTFKSVGIRVPEEMAVIAVGQVPMGAELLTPSLTTVFCQWQEFAAEAWRFLLGSILRPGGEVPQPGTGVLKNYLFERQSARSAVQTCQLQEK